MLTTKNLALTIDEVPTSWIFEHFGHLDQMLSGQTLTIHSLFKNERTPSMKIFLGKDDNVYFFKDYSSGKGGGAVRFVMELHDITASLAINWILHEYNNYLINGGVPKKYREIIPRHGFKVSDYEIRKWSETDKEFWTKYNISSALLAEYRVQPLDWFRMQKDTEGRIESIKIERLRIYGYFKNDGTLYKIYQPGAKKKFINVSSYLQGEDQLKGYNNLLICSSLKDIMSVRSLGLKVDLVAPDSETQLIAEVKIREFEQRFHNIAVMFDNDQAGIEGMIRYREILGIRPLLLPMEKDISDSISIHGPGKVRSRLVPLLDQVFSFRDLAA